MSAAALRWAVTVLALLLASCAPAGQVLDAGAAPTGQSAETFALPTSPSAAPSEEPSAPSEDATSRDDDEDLDGDRPDGPEDDGAEGGDDTATARRRTTTVSVYFTRGDGVESIPRVVPQVARIGSAAMEQLLAGPTDAEIATGYGTHIPDGTRLRDLTIAGGVAVVDLSSEFDAGASTFGLSLRLAQVACTLDAFATVDGVRFAIDGRVVDVFDGDGQVTDRPVTCGDYTRTSAGDLLPPTEEPS
ncbi:MAG TPA: GerMN domain-containing protein [Euzebyales bacterium]|nr:GerMN domain-containing protein [Euzebyales bacterium]